MAYIEYKNKIINYMKTNLVIAAPIFLALLGIGVLLGVGWGVTTGMAKIESQKYEAMKEWKLDLTENLQMTAIAKTKLVNGKMLALVNLIGYPAYLSNPVLYAKNINGSIVIEFVDTDGFELYSKTIFIKDFSSHVNSKGEKIGLNYQFSEGIDISKYSKFNDMKIAWRLITEIPKEQESIKVIKPIKNGMAKGDSGDHCAPNLSKTERLRRLALKGTVREVGDRTYEAGWSEFRLSYDGSIYSCR
jgi:hypothetical protein